MSVRAAARFVVHPLAVLALIVLLPFLGPIAVLPMLTLAIWREAHLTRASGAEGEGK